MMRKLLTGMIALAAVTVLPSHAAEALAPQWPGTYIGCQDWNAPGGMEWPTPKSRPRTCSLLLHDHFEGAVPRSDSLRLSNVRWKYWGGRRTVGRATITIYPRGTHASSFPGRIVGYDIARSVDPADCGSPGPSNYQRVQVTWGRKRWVDGKRRRSLILKNEPAFQC